MARIDVVNKIGIYELGGKISNDEKLEVSNHWNSNSYVVLKFKNVEITVVTGDLEAAIKNATNAR